jgi:hypothetical protein
MGDPQTRSAVQCRMISPQFVVPDVVVAAKYYRDVFRFCIFGYFLDPPVYAVLARASGEIHFLEKRTLAPPLRPTSGGPSEV